MVAVKADKCIAAYRQLREQPVWKLLAQRHGLFVIGLIPSIAFRHLFFTNASAVTWKNCASEAKTFRSRPRPMWRKSGFVERGFPSGAAEEEHESLRRPRPLSDSSLGSLNRAWRRRRQPARSVIQQLVKLAEATDTNPETRREPIRVFRDDAGVPRAAGGCDQPGNQVRKQGGQNQNAKSRLKFP